MSDEIVTLTRAERRALALFLVVERLADWCIPWEDVPYLDEDGYDRLVLALGVVVEDLGIELEDFQRVHEVDADSVWLRVQGEVRS